MDISTGCKGVKLNIPLLFSKSPPSHPLEEAKIAIKMSKKNKSIDIVFVKRTWGFPIQLVLFF